jgi:hypothetical protein
LAAPAIIASSAFGMAGDFSSPPSMGCSFKGCACAAP